jgi:cytidylate kinase
VKYDFLSSGHPLADAITPRKFEAILREIVAAHIKQKDSEFDDLVLSLPSVYPAQVLKALRQLSNASSRAKEIADRVCIPRNGNNKEIADDLPPHPLDYDWRFTAETTEHLAKRVDSLCSRSNTWIGLGTPSLFQQPCDRRRVLIDRNRSLIQRVTCTQFVCRDLLSDPLPHVTGSVIVADPPWYPEEMRGFLWAARRMCTPGATVLLAIPQVGTRPGINRDLHHIAEWIQALGFRVGNVERGVLVYDSPLFESVSLAAVGILNYPRCWRRADLVTLEANSPLAVARPRVSRRRWKETIIGAVRLRILEEPAGKFRQPSLVSLTPNDSPISISRRDPRRRKAKVWTSCNRIFDTAASGLILEIARAIASGKPAVDRVEKHLRRPLTRGEKAKVHAATQQLRSLIDQEQREIESKNSTFRQMGMLSSASGETPANVLKHVSQNIPTDAGVHVAIFIEPFLKYLLDGRKTVESRFSRTRRAPFKQVHPGDIILLKRTGGPIVGLCRVAQVWSYVLNPSSWKEVKQFASSICADSSFWTDRAKANYATLIRIDNVQRITPLRLEKQSRLGWLVLRKYQRKLQMLVGIAGRPGSGKTTVARAVAPKIAARVLSFGHFFRGLAGDSNVQDFGANYIASRSSAAVVEEFLDFYGVAAGEPVIVEGVRHVAIWKALAARAQSAFLIYLHAEQRVLEHRIDIRSSRRDVNAKDRLQHRVESEHNELRELADQVVVSRTVVDSVGKILDSLRGKAA